MTEVPPHLQALLHQATATARDMRADYPAAQAEHRCVAPPAGCGEPIPSLPTAFVDQASRREYDITGLCQICQDKLFTPSEDERAQMDADPTHYDRCPVCGEYREIEFVDVGVGVMSGFNCCYLRYGPPNGKPYPPRCTRMAGCGLCEGHRHGCTP